MQRLCFGQKANANLQSPKNSRLMSQKIQKKVILRLKIQHVLIDLIHSMVDFPLKDFDISEYVLNQNLPEDYFKGENQ